MKKVNFFMLIQWAVFIPIILPISIVVGAMEGIKMTAERALTDIMEEKELV